jgi:malate dehydrogenase (oxaloacetate-decarboxylating)
MLQQRKTKFKQLNKTVQIPLRGQQLLNTPTLNKGTAFTLQERLALNLLGLLPPQVETLAEQVTRAYKQITTFVTAKQKILFLNSLFHTNQTLFYKILQIYFAELAPVVYTPHIATTIQNFNEEFFQPFGLYLSYPDQHNFTKIFDTITADIELVIVTDGERILGIGDQGIGGIGIAIGKLMLYVALGGIKPTRILPIILDVGTNNQQLLTNPFYLGWRCPRITGNDYDNFIASFIATLKQRFKYTLLHWEDFGRQNAARLLEFYRTKLCSFNDDIQGTSIVTLAALLTAVKIKNQSITEQRIVFLGAGSSAVGIANTICMAMQREGLPLQEAQQRIWMLDINGLLTQNSRDINKFQQPYVKTIAATTAWEISNREKLTLLDVVKNVKPTILIGCSTAQGAFTETIVKTMAKYTEQPIIFPLSNPTANSEAHPQDLINWTDGKALIATGSPFEPAEWQGTKINITQCNNALVFPGIGLGILAVQAKKVSDAMLFAACKTLFNETAMYLDSCLQENNMDCNNEHQSFNLNLPLLPALKDAAKVAKKIAYAIAQQACLEGLSQCPETNNTNNKTNNFEQLIEQLIAANFWTAAY